MESVDRTSTGDYWAEIRVTAAGTEKAFTNAGAIITKPGPSGGGQRTIYSDFVNGPDATVTANADLSILGIARNQGTMTVAAGRSLGFTSLTQPAGTLDVRGSLYAGDFAYQGGAITGGGRISRGAPGKRA
jgi:hypothetical protein